MKRFIAAVLIFAVVSETALQASPEDRKIEETARASYNFRTVLAGRVSVQSRNGVVTLSGLVEDMEDVALAADMIYALPGVARINNEIMVQASVAKHSDAWVALRIRRRLLAQANVNAAATTIEVKEGVVTLTGTAENAAQKELTAVCAQDVDRVKSVRNELVVSASVPAGAVAGEVIDDASITSQVRRTLLTHRTTSSISTGIETKDGVVAVTGEVATAAEKAFVTKLAEGVRGVKAVNNQMTVKT
jgi:hyperosmotically inducible protein